jgi:hypothetical protein
MRLGGKRFSVHPLSLGLLPSASSITVVPDTITIAFPKLNCLNTEQEEMK